MAKPVRPERSRRARSLRQVSRFYRSINPDRVFGTDNDVARNQLTHGHKAAADFAAADSVDFIHVRRDAVVDTVTPSAVAADDIEISFGVKLGALLGR